MRRRIYFLAPDLGVTRTIIDELRAAEFVDEQHVGVIARDDITHEDVPESTLLQSSDIKEGAGHGVAYGGVVGLVAGLVAVAIPPVGLVLGGGILAGVLGGASVGAIVGGFIGSYEPNRELEEFEGAIKRGEILILVDAPMERVDEVEELVRSKHPNVKFGGTEPHDPAFP